MDDIDTQEFINILMGTDENMTPLIALFFICEYHSNFNGALLTMIASSLNISNELENTAEYYMARSEFFNYIHKITKFKKAQLLNCIQE